MVYCMNMPLFFNALIIDGYLGCFHFLGFVKNAAMDMGVQVSF